MRWLLGALALLVSVALGLAAWLVATEPGLQWAVARLEAMTDGKLSTEGLQGTLTREIRISSLRYVDDTLEVDLRNGALQLELPAILGGRATISSMRVESLALRLGEAGEAASQPMVLPLSVRVDHAEIAKLEIERPGERYSARELQLRDVLFERGGAGLGESEIDEVRVERGEDAYSARMIRLKGVQAGESDARVQRADVASITVQHAGESYIAEKIQLRDAVLREGGDIAASLSLAIRHEGYPANLALKADGTIERMGISLEGTVAGIPVHGKGTIAPRAERPLQAVTAEAGPINLRRLDPEWPLTALTVTLSGKAGPSHALAGAVTARNARPGPLDKEMLPATSLQGQFATDFSSVALSKLRVQLSPGGTLAGSGDIRPGLASFNVQVNALDLSALRSTLRRTALDGSFKIVHAGEKQAIEGTIAEAGMSITADVLRTGDIVEIRSIRAAADKGEATGSGRVRIGEPTSFEARLELARFDPSRFGDYPSGDINASIDATGNWGPDLSVQARWQIKESLLEGERFTSRGTGHFSANRVTKADMEARFGSARARVRGAFGNPGDQLALEIEVPRIEDFAESIAGSLRASGQLSGTWDTPQAAITVLVSSVRLPNGLALERISAKASGSLVNHAADISLVGEDLDLDARLRGSWEGDAGWNGELLAMRNAGRYPMKLTAPAPVRVAPGRIELGRLEASLGDGELLVEKLHWQNGELASVGSFSGLPGHWVILAAGLTDRIASTLLVDGEWSVAAAPRLTGSIRIRRAEGDLTVLGDTPISLGLQTSAIDARLKDGHVDATATATGRYGTVSLKGSLTPEASAPGLGLTPQSRVALEAQVKLAELRVLTQPLITDARLDGRVSAELRVTGTLGRPELGGSLQGNEISFDVPPYGVFLKGGELRAVLQGDVLRVTGFSIQGGEGRFVATGTLPLHAGDAGPRLDWRAERFGVLERPDMRLVVSGAGAASVTAGRVSLSGALRADRGYLELDQERLPRLGDDVVIVGEPHAPAEHRTQLPLALDLQLDLGDALQVRGYGLEGRIAGRLQIATSKEGELRVFGRIQTVNATFMAYGNRLQVDPGVAIFDGPLNNPALQMTAWRRNLPVEAGVQVTGTAAAPRVQLVSQPPVPEGERLSWLVLGRAPADATKADLGLLQAAAGALLARGDQVPLDRRIARAFGVDEIALRGSGEIADRVVAVGKRLSDRLYVSYEHGLGITATTLVKLDYALTQRLAVRAETGTTSGIGLFYRFSWD
jgi:translocation and assembly module TamB